MSKRKQSFEVPRPLASVEIACRQALAGMGWEAIGDRDGTLVAREDIAGLGCHNQPAQTTLSFAGDQSRSTLAIETTVPGRGPVSSTHARRSQEAVVAAVEDKLQTGGVYSAYDT